MSKQSKTNETGTQQPKAKPAWEIFFTDESGRVIERPWEDKTTGERGITWDKRSAPCERTTKGGDPTLQGKLALPDGKEIRLAFRRPRERRTAAAQVAGSSANVRSHYAPGLLRNAGGISVLCPLFGK